MQKSVTWAQQLPFWGWFIIPLARLDIVSLCKKFDSFSHSWDMGEAQEILNGSCDVTTPLSGTVAGTSYSQPVYQIWNFYVHPLRRY